MPVGKPLTDTQIRNAIKIYVDNGESITFVADNTDIAYDTLKTLFKDITTNTNSKRYNKYNTFYTECKTQKEVALKEEAEKHFKESARIREEILQKLEKAMLLKVDSMLDNKEELTDTNLTQLTTGYGTLTDKHRLINGDSTSNDTIKFKLPVELDEYANWYNLIPNTIKRF